MKWEGTPPRTHRGISLQKIRLRDHIISIYFQVTQKQTNKQTEMQWQYGRRIQGVLPAEPYHQPTRTVFIDEPLSAGLSPIKILSWIHSLSIPQQPCYQRLISWEAQGFFFLSKTSRKEKGWYKPLILVFLRQRQGQAVQGQPGLWREFQDS